LFDWYTIDHYRSYMITPKPPTRTLQQYLWYNSLEAAQLIKISVLLATKIVDGRTNVNFVKFNDKAKYKSRAITTSASNVIKGDQRWVISSACIFIMWINDLRSQSRIQPFDYNIVITVEVEHVVNQFRIRTIKYEWTKSYRKLSRSSSNTLFLRFALLVVVIGSASARVWTDCFGLAFGTPISKSSQSSNDSGTPKLVLRGWAPAIGSAVACTTKHDKAWGLQTTYVHRMPPQHVGIS